MNAGLFTTFKCSEDGVTAVLQGEVQLNVKAVKRIAYDRTSSHERVGKSGQTRGCVCHTEHARAQNIRSRFQLCLYKAQVKSLICTSRLFGEIRKSL